MNEKNNRENFEDKLREIVRKPKNFEEDLRELKQKAPEPETPNPVYKKPETPKIKVRPRVYAEPPKPKVPEIPGLISPIEIIAEVPSYPEKEDVSVRKEEYKPRKIKHKVESKYTSPKKNDTAGTIGALMTVIISCSLGMVALYSQKPRDGIQTPEVLEKRKEDAPVSRVRAVPATETTRVGNIEADNGRLEEIVVDNPKETSTYNIPNSIFNKYHRWFRQDNGDQRTLYNMVIDPDTNSLYGPEALRTEKAKKSRWRQYVLLNAKVVDCTTNEPIEGVDVKNVNNSNFNSRTNREGIITQKLSSGVNNYLRFSKEGYIPITIDTQAGDWIVKLAQEGWPEHGKKQYKNPYLKKLQEDFFNALDLIGQSKSLTTGLLEGGKIEMAPHHDVGVNRYSPIVPKQLYLDFSLDCLRANAYGDIGGKHWENGTDELMMRIVNNKYIQLQAVSRKNGILMPAKYYPISVLNER